MAATDEHLSSLKQVVFMPAATQTTTFNKYQTRQSKINGSLQIVIGTLSIIACAVDLCHIAIIYKNPVMFSIEIGCGILFIVVGLLGVCSGKDPIRCKILAFMVLTIIAAAMSAILFFFELINDFFIRRDQGFLCLYYNRSTDISGRRCVNAHPILVATGYSLLALSLLEVGVSIWGSAICCKAICISDHDQVAGVLYETNTKIQSPPEHIQLMPVPVQSTSP